jgi:NACHT domain/Ankyrin repeat
MGRAEQKPTTSETPIPLKQFNDLLRQEPETAKVLIRKKRSPPDLITAYRGFLDTQATYLKDKTELEALTARTLIQTQLAQLETITDGELCVVYTETIRALLKHKMLLTVGPIASSQYNEYSTHLKTLSCDLVDAQGNTPLHLAAQAGDADAVAFFILGDTDINRHNKDDYYADVNQQNDAKQYAIDLAWKKAKPTEIEFKKALGSNEELKAERYRPYRQCVLTLLKLDSRFPLDPPPRLEGPSKFQINKLHINDLPEADAVTREIKKFIKQRKKLHALILDGELTLLKQRFVDHSDQADSRYYLNTENESALFAAAQAHAFEIYGFLKSKSIHFFSDYEKDEFVKILENKKEGFQEAVVKYSAQEPEHLMHLIALSRCIPDDNSKSDQRLESIQAYYKQLDAIPEISIILKSLVVIPKSYRIIFDFDKDEIIEIEGGSRHAAGLVDRTADRVYIGAKVPEQELLGTLAHELTHLALRIVYQNECNPYTENDLENKNKFSKITQALNDKTKQSQLEHEIPALRREIQALRDGTQAEDTITKVLEAKTKALNDKTLELQRLKDVQPLQDPIEIDDIIVRVFTAYKKPEQWNAEMITRVPHLLGKYGATLGREKLAAQAPGLFDFFKQHTQPDCEQFIERIPALALIDTNKRMIRMLNHAFGLERLQQTDIKFIAPNVFDVNDNPFILITTPSAHLSQLKMIQEFAHQQALNPLFLTLDQRLIDLAKEVGNVVHSGVSNKIILTCPPNGATAWETLKNILARHKDPQTHVIVIIQDHDPLLDKFKEQYTDRYQTQTHLDSDLNFNSLTLESQTTLLNKEIFFQGQSVKLRQIIDPTTYVIDATFLAHLITQERVMLGHELSNLGEIEPYYINRIFNQPTELLNYNNLLEAGTDLLAFSHITQEHLAELIPNTQIRSYQEPDFNPSNPTRIIVLDQDHAAEEFSLLCQQYPQHNLHWFKRVGDRSIWQQTYGSRTGLRPYLSDRTQSERQLLNQNKNMLIADSAGMGKTTVLTHIARRIKDIFPEVWVLRINLNDFTKILDRKLQKQSQSSFTQKQAINFLLNKLSGPWQPWEKTLIKSCFYQPNKLVILLDGFDEISPDYENLLLNLVQSLQSTQIKQLWLTTRPHLRTTLEDRFKTFAYTLQPFSKTEQIELLIKFWRVDNPKSWLYASRLLKTFSDSIQDQKHTFTSIALQTYLLAEAFASEFNDFIQSEAQYPKLPEKLNLFDLYPTCCRKEISYLPI